MAKKFPFSTWIYNYVEEFSPDEIDVLADAGMTVTMSPKMVYGKHDLKMMIPYLDRAQERDIQLIVWIEGLENSNYGVIGAEEYERRFREAYEALKHPALYGFFIGDEPGSAEEFENSWKAIKLQKTIAPELRPYLNLATNMDSVSKEKFGGRTFRQWLAEMAADTGFSNFSYGHYDQLWNDDGIESYYSNLNALSAAAKGANVDLWNTMLLSGHYMFRVPTEYELLWQITTAAACGSRGVNWFRFYDRAHGPNYHGSPIDEYGNKGPLYEAMVRVQRGFNVHYGELIMSLKHKKSYLTHKPMGGFGVFGSGSHEAIDCIRSTEQAVVGFFEAEDGTEYMAIVNGSQTTPGVFRVFFDHDKYDVSEVLYNGKEEIPYPHNHTEAFWDGQWIYPGQLNMFKITKK